VKFAFIRVEKAHHSISALCRNLGVTRQGYYQFEARRDEARIEGERPGPVRPPAPLAKRNKWQSPEREAAVKAARDEKDATKRAQLYMDLQKSALNDSPYIIMFQQVETAAVRSNVNGLIIGPTFDSNLYSWVVKN